MILLFLGLWLTLGSIESMKMETVIRSPQDGVVKKLAHKEGVSILGLRSFYDVFANFCVGHMQGGDCARAVRGACRGGVDGSAVDGLL